MNDDVKYSVQTFDLAADSELRFGVPDNETCIVQLKNGSAEIFGMSLLNSIKYEFSADAKIAVFTWHGCTLELMGKPEFVYKSSETPMNYYVNYHAHSEEERKLATAYDLTGPTIMIAGPPCVGKSSLCKMLLNWAVRQGRCPIYVDLDVMHGDISLHGTVAALVVEESINVSTGFSGRPLILHFGSQTPDSCCHTFNLVTSKLAQLCREKISKNKKIRHSGLIINTPSYFKGSDSKVLIHVARAFDVSIILVVDQERLQHDFMRAGLSKVEVALVPKSVGIEQPMPLQKMEDYENNIVRRYFYGAIEPLIPDDLELAWSEVKIFKSVSSSLLPHEQRVHSMKLVKIAPGLNLLNLILSMTKSEEKEDVIGRVVIGFVRVVNVNVDDKTITIMCPHRTFLQNSVLLMNDY